MNNYDNLVEECKGNLKAARSKIVSNVMGALKDSGKSHAQVKELVEFDKYVRSSFKKKWDDNSGKYIDALDN